MRKIKIAKFEGPLDLLLQLIEQEQMDISQVALAQVTEQYLLALEQAEDFSAEELADFLVIAAKLLLIKSRILLPQLAVDGQEEASDLEKQLKIFKEYLEASKNLAKIIHKRRFTFGRGKPTVMIEKKFSPPEKLTPDLLKELFLGVLKEIELVVSLPKAVVEKTVSISEKIEVIRVMILDKALVSFKSIIKEAKTKTEIIVSFLAVLELVKQRTVTVKQSKLFQDIEIQKIDNQV
ncbi:segregation/condensation protein A [Candidatus Parcubacteria bacterium]|nr:MAG: segregation/condensation protein A [Candidatus Parcubacteria bacterium]